MPPFPQKHAPNGVQGRAGGGPISVRVVLQEVDHGPPHCLQFSVGPCREAPPVTGESAEPSTRPTPGPPGREAHTGESRTDHLRVTSVGTGEPQSPLVWRQAPGTCPPTASAEAGRTTSPAGPGAGTGVIHKNSPGSPGDACTFPNFCFLKKFT